MSNRGPSVVMGDIQWGPERYPVLWCWEPYEEPRNGKYGEYHAFPMHRLTAFAEGIIDHPRFEDDGVVGFWDDPETGETVVRNKPDRREVHHVDEDKMNYDARNLEAYTSEVHGRKTRAAQLAADGGETDV